MQTFSKSLLNGFKFKDGYFSFKFGEKDEYELTFEPLIFGNQYYVALYKDGELLINKVVIKPGFEVIK